jgi:tetratricopeptide (TPR) repeat protein
VEAGQAAESDSALAEAVGHYERALELWDQAAEAAARSPLDRGALLERLARYHWTAGDTPKAVVAVERAVATIPPEPPSEELARALAAHGQLLMLLSHHADARARCEEAVAVARQVGARAVEGHALTTLGTTLGVLGHLEEGIAYLEQGHHIARELANVDDLGRVHANLASILDMAGRSADAVEVYLTGVEVVRQTGALGRYGPNLLPDAANALVSLGRREEAERLLDEVFDLDLQFPRHWTRRTPRPCSWAWPRPPSGTVASRTRVPPPAAGWSCSPPPTSPSGSPSWAAPGWPSRPPWPSGPARATPTPRSRPRASWRPA